MNAGRALSVASVIISAISLAIGFWGSNGVMTVASFIALCFSIVNVRYSPDRFRLAIIMSAVLLVCTILITTVFSYETLVVSENIMTKATWVFVAGPIYAIAVIPITFMAYFVIAAISNASYNWAVVSGLTVFIGLGIHSAGYAMTYVFFLFGLEKHLSENYIAIYGLIIGLLTLVIFTILLNRIFLKNRYLITANGLGVFN